MAKDFSDVSRRSYLLEKGSTAKVAARKFPANVRRAITETFQWYFPITSVRGLVILLSGPREDNRIVKWTEEYRDGARWSRNNYLHASQLRIAFLAAYTKKYTVDKIPRLNTKSFITHARTYGFQNCCKNRCSNVWTVSLLANGLV